MKVFLIFAVIIVLTACAENKEVPQEISPIEESRNITNYDEVEISLGEAATTILDTGINRVNNIQIACESISGTSLFPGDEFSFNKVVGERSHKKGYKDAPIIFHGEKSYGTGGGVCQVSSTVYMAAVNAGMEITERHTHSEKVSYAPGSDATVVYGEKDMRFKNNTEDSVFIYTWVQEEKVYAKIVKNEKTEY